MTKMTLIHSFVYSQKCSVHFRVVEATGETQDIPPPTLSGDFSATLTVVLTTIGAGARLTVVSSFHKVFC